MDKEKTKKCWLFLRFQPFAPNQTRTLCTDYHSKFLQFEYYTDNPLSPLLSKEVIFELKTLGKLPKIDHYATTIHIMCPKILDEVIRIFKRSVQPRVEQNTDFVIIETKIKGPVRDSPMVEPWSEEEMSQYMGSRKTQRRVWNPAIKRAHWQNISIIWKRKQKGDIHVASWRSLILVKSTILHEYQNRKATKKALIHTHQLFVKSSKRKTSVTTTKTFSH